MWGYEKWGKLGLYRKKIKKFKKLNTSNGSWPEAAGLPAAACKAATTSSLAGLKFNFFFIYLMNSNMSGLMARPMAQPRRHTGLTWPTTIADCTIFPCFRPGQPTCLHEVFDKCHHFRFSSPSKAVTSY